MKSVFLLEQRIFNGTVLIATINTGFSTKELAEKVLQSTKKANENSEFINTYNINEIQIYEEEHEVPILKYCSYAFFKLMIHLRYLTPVLPALSFSFWIITG